MNIFLVGGAVRDQLLGYPYSEKDWVVVGAEPEELISQGFRPVGKDFPVFLHPDTGEEYALARTERKVSPGYKGFSFHADKSISLEQDLSRRDLTINAMAQDKQGQIIDPYGGQRDMTAKILRHVGSAFTEDPVRILRAARFAARYHHLGFRVADETQSLMQDMVAAGETRHLVAERVWQECHKALAEQSPEQFFDVLKNSHALRDIFPELDTSHLPHHLAQLNAVSKLSKETGVRFASLCYPLSDLDIQSMSTRLALPNNYRELATLVSQYHSDIEQTTILSTQKVADILKRTDALRKTQRFEKVINCCSLLAGTNNNTIQYFWTNCLKAYQQVDPKALIAEGYTKASLGDAILQRRIKQLDNWIQTYE